MYMIFTVYTLTSKLELVFLKANLLSQRKNIVHHALDTNYVPFD